MNELVKEPKSWNVTELPNGDLLYEDHIWWNFSDWKKGKNPVCTNWDDPFNVRFTFDKDGNLKSVEKI
jgi:hypothetical protein